MEIVMPSVIELDLGLHKALEAHRISLELSLIHISEPTRPY